MCWELDLQDNSGERGDSEEVLRSEGDSEEVMRSEGSAPLKQIRVGGGDLSGQWAPDRRRVRGSLSLPPSSLPLMLSCPSPFCYGMIK